MDEEQREPYDIPWFRIWHCQLCGERWKDELPIRWEGYISSYQAEEMVPWHHKKAAVKRLEQAWDHPNYHHSVSTRQHECSPSAVGVAVVVGVVLGISDLEMLGKAFDDE